MFRLESWEYGYQKLELESSSSNMVCSNSGPLCFGNHVVTLASRPLICMTLLSTFSVAVAIDELLWLFCGEKILAELMDVDGRIGTFFCCDST
jgi:hypothetical protein